MIKILIFILILTLFSGCQLDSQSDEESTSNLVYNIIEPGNGIYAISQKNTTKEATSDNNHEIVYYDNSNISKIERYDASGKLTDNFSVAAVTCFEYDNDNRVKYVKYYDRNENKWEDDIFGYWSIEYVYDETGRVRMEIYRDAEFKFLKVPRNMSGDIAKINFIAPILTYEYTNDTLKIKAFDENFNLLKEAIGDKPCIPFIDCGESD